MSIDFKYPPGATPLDPNEITGLIPMYKQDNFLILDIALGMFMIQMEPES